jgi:hypothetical protein
VWGCPAIDLEPQLQNDQKLPKWNRRACIGQFLGYLDQRLSLVAGHVSPQFHVVFGDLFKMVIQNGDKDWIVNSICDGLFERNWELYIEDEFDADDNLIYTPPPLHDAWLNETGRHQGKEDLLRQRCRNEDLMHTQCRNVRETIGRTPTRPVWWILSLIALPSRMTRVLLLQFAVKIQNQRETLWMTMMMMTALFISQIHLLHQI